MYKEGGNKTSWSKKGHEITNLKQQQQNPQIVIHELPALQSLWIINATSPKLWKLHHPAELKPSPKLTSSLCLVFFAVAFMSEWSTRKNLYIRKSVYASFSSVLCLGKWLLEFCLSLQVVKPTQLLSVYIYNPRCVGLSSITAAAAVSNYCTAANYRIVLFYLNKKQRLSLGLLSAVAGVWVCWIMPR